MTKFRDRLYLFLPAFLVAMVVCNVVGFFWSHKRHDDERRNFIMVVQSFTNQLYQVRSAFSNEVLRTFRVTSDRILSASVSPLPSFPPLPSSQSLTNSSLCVSTTRYHFYKLAGRPAVRFYGSDYFEGDVCSLGRISRIFPDRFFLSDGCFVLNTFNPDGGDFFCSRSHAQMETKHNE